ncbi:gfo/Idh/MocA family oxidoreductase [Lacihabitans sp. LS3-19]|uniref:Gfo/Idh/MocA family protein n=1 Tax=Lacihabitans sp. LS3-19 TaxID=2487335 RepID=UPI0020CF1EA8|nr:Gfo/Idh/MocA family oxidoreductase [Lacihabitans sp. LS3-19]MCP9769697.1 gfo/Idh/MocA family oxidoreductase [Lacihabitans sp. LS3-19]
MKETIKWGILGAGRIAAKFAADLNKTPGCELLAVASTSLERAQEFALEYNGKHAFGSYQELFSTEIDVVYVATPHTSHKEHTLLCLNNNVGVLCEKPFAMNQGEVDEMIQLAKEKGLFLMEAMWTRFLPTTLKAQSLIAEGKIGNIKTIAADFGFKAEFDPKSRLFDPKLGGGAFLDIGIYPAFLSLLFLDYPSKILAASIFAPTNTDETTSFVYRYDNESTAVLNCTVKSNTDCEARIYGDMGSIKLNRKFHMATSLTLMDVDGNEVETFDYPRDTFGYNYEIEEVNKCIANKQTESELMPLSLSLKLIHLLDKTREAATIVY